MRKYLLYLFIGGLCATPAFCADGVRSGAPVSRSVSTDVHSVSRGAESKSQSSRIGAVSRDQSVARTISDRVLPDNNDSRLSARTGTNSRASRVNVTPVLSRNIVGRAAKQPISAESIAQAKDVLEQTAQLNKSCQDQYNECMDQFCSVVDVNQKRCSCSANLSNYAKVEEAVTNANNELNEVAQRIRYVGLSADEIRAILSETEAEAALSGQKDTTETRSMLEDIEKLIKDPTSSTSYYSSSSGADFGLDMDLDFTSGDTDLFSLDFLTNSATSSISNKRGTELYNVARNRCNTILNECKKAGGTITQVTGNYDLAIDKDCIAYEQGLNKMNDTLVSNVRSANLLLQKARLAVLQNKNQYDAKDCIGALETCMLDDMVCGDGYVKCLDPTKKYIDENGQVVLGQNITNITQFLGDEFDNSNIDNILQGLQDSGWKKPSECNSDGECIIQYLMSKIGTGPTFRDGGLCRPVLDKCQYYTYTDDGYEPINDVVINYLQRTMTNIRAQQTQVISDYASSCMLDVANCYNQQVTQVNAWSSVASASSIKNVMTGACRNVALTCAYAIFANDESSCDNDSNCIANISEMFYQSLLCPDNSTYQTTVGAVASNGTVTGYVNATCKCNSGYTVWGGACVPNCADGEERDTYGTCTKNQNN